MEAVAAVSTGLVALGLTVAVVLLARWLRVEVSARGVEQDGRTEAVRLMRVAESERDEERAARVKADAETKKAFARASVFEEAYAKARKELESHIREKLVTGSDADVSDEVDRLLGAVPAVHLPAEAASGDHGRTGPEALLDPSEA